MKDQGVLIDETRRGLAASPELPLLRLQALTTLSPVGFALISGVSVFFLMLLPIPLGNPGSEIVRDLFASALFFGSSVGIVAGCSAPVFRGACEDLSQLEQVIGLSPEDLSLLQASLTRSTPGWLGLWTAVGIFAGLMHCYFLGTFNMPFLYAAFQFFATMLLWIIMNWTVPFLVINALLFSRLGQLATPDLLRPSRHAGFGAAALRPALFVVAIVCTYPLLLLGGDDALQNATLIGAIASIITLPIIVILPLRGIRRRIREQRESILAELDARLDKTTRGDIANASAADLFELDAVLDMRERVARAPAWPFNLNGIKRILLYVVLPPLTWAAAAIVEMLIDNSI